MSTCFSVFFSIDDSRLFSLLNFSFTSDFNASNLGSSASSDFNWFIWDTNSDLDESNCCLVYSFKEFVFCSSALFIINCFFSNDVIPLVKLSILDCSCDDCSIVLSTFSNNSRVLSTRFDIDFISAYWTGS